MKIRCAALLLLALAGCNQQGGSGEQQARVAKVEEELQATQEELRTLKALYDFDRSMDIAERQIKLSVDGDGYQRLMTNLGVALVAVESAEPYLDGFKLKMLIGNMSAATLDGAELTVSWKNDQPKGIDDMFHERKVSTVQRFPAGAWTAIEAKLTPLPKEKLRGLVLTISFSEVILRRP